MDDTKKPVPQGFVRQVASAPPKLDSAERAQLVRKGNELLNKGNLELAERIFVTCGWGDGLARVGDAHLKKRNYRKAMELYVRSKDEGRIQRMSVRIARVVRQWLLEDGVAPPSPGEPAAAPDQTGGTKA